MEVAQYRGFTLLEIIISVAALATVGILITQVLFTTTRVNTKSVLLQDIKQNGNFAIDVMGRMIRGALANTTICLSGTTTNELTILDQYGNPVTLKCKADGLSARIASVSGDKIDYLTGANVTIASGNICENNNSLTFSCPESAGVPGPVHIQFSLQQVGTDPNAFATSKTSFDTTVSPRN